MTIKRNSVKEISKRYGLFLLGIIAGWSIAHHFTIHMGGQWPDASVFGYLLTFGDVPGLTVLAGLLFSFFRKHQTRRND